MPLLVAAAQTDQTGRVIALLMASLIAIALGLALLTIWYWRFTDPRRRAEAAEPAGRGFEPVEVVPANAVAETVVPAQTSDSRSSTVAKAMPPVHPLYPAPTVEWAASRPVPRPLLPPVRSDRPPGMGIHSIRRPLDLDAGWFDPVGSDLDPGPPRTLFAPDDQPPVSPAGLAAGPPPDAVVTGLVPDDAGLGQPAHQWSQPPVEESVAGEELPAEQERPVAPNSATEPVEPGPEGLDADEWALITQAVFDRYLEPDGAGSAGDPAG